MALGLSSSNSIPSRKLALWSAMLSILALSTNPFAFAAQSSTPPVQPPTNQAQSKDAADPLASESWQRRPELFHSETTSYLYPIGPRKAAGIQIFNCVTIL